MSTGGFFGNVGNKDIVIKHDIAKDFVNRLAKFIMDCHLGTCWVAYGAVSRLRPFLGDEICDKIKDQLYECVENVFAYNNKTEAISIFTDILDEVWGLDGFDLTICGHRESESPDDMLEILQHRREEYHAAYHITPGSRGISEYQSVYF